MREFPALQLLFLAQASSGSMPKVAQSIMMIGRSGRDDVETERSDPVPLGRG